MEKQKRLLKAAELLEAKYGIPRWAHEKHDPVSTLVGTILSQNTSDRNSIPAFDSLRKKYATWEKVLNASEKEIAKAIRRGGLANIKARRIKQALAAVKEKSGKLSLSFLKGKSKAEAREFLLSLPGVGWKTASIVLLFSLGIFAFPVDTHISRVSKRLGFIPKDSSLEKAHTTMDKLVPDRLKASFHGNLIFLGRALCHPRNPECGKCPLNKICPSYSAG